jgi:methylenetetrahydrofolate dehydrogenase (NADP+) / methenyltetrahydrofolate cyclohydrolase
MNVGKLVLGDPTAFKPATPYGVQQMLRRSGIETRGARAVVVGRSTIVGRPMANLLLQPGPGGDATVTIAHSRTRDLPCALPRGGHAGRGDRQGAVPRRRRGEARGHRHRRRHQSCRRCDRPKGYRVVGDVAFEAVREVAGAITPVPGGVGKMTIAMLLANTLQAATLQHGVR